MRYYLVTGAGSGIGRAIALKLSRERDHSVILAGRRIGALKETADLLDYRANHELLQLDVTSPESLAKAVEDFPYNHLDGVIANAGIGGENRFGPEDRWDEILQTNLTGTYRSVMHFLPLLLKTTSKYRYVVILSSVLARLGVPGYAAYCASKAGLLGLMRSWAVEWSRERILVNALCPGWVQTEMAESGIREMAENMKLSYDEALQLALAGIPLGKMATPDEVAALVTYLLNQTSITGQVLDINNGSVMA